MTGVDLDRRQDHRAEYELVSFPKSQDAARSFRPRGPLIKQLSGKDIPMRLNGTVKFYNGTRGFGFIAPEGGDKDVFVHASALEKSGMSSLQEGDKVSFELEDDNRGRGKQAAKIEMS
jgi:CspA family cold shock protein